MSERYDHFINGRTAAPVRGEYFPSSNPATLEVLYEAARGTKEDVDAAVEAAGQAFENPLWRDLSATKRGHLLRRLGDLVVENAEDLARMETQDNGKLLREMRAQLATLPEYLYYYAGLADKVQGSQIPTSSIEVLNYTQREPLGVVGAITPWNSPLTLTTSKLAPALAAGNTLVIKPSEYTSRTVLRLAELATEAGFPDGVINVVTGYGDRGRRTPGGSPEAGQDLLHRHRPPRARPSRPRRPRASSAATLELGGKSPNIVFGDANVDNAAMGVIAGIFAAAGQTCIAGSRVFAHRSVYDELLEKVAQRARSIVIGDPMLEATELGPLAFDAQQREGELLRGTGRLRGGHRPHRRVPSRCRTARRTSTRPPC